MSFFPKSRQMSSNLLYSSLLFLRHNGAFLLEILDSERKIRLEEFHKTRWTQESNVVFPRIIQSNFFHFILSSIFWRGYKFLQYLNKIQWPNHTDFELEKQYVI